MKEKINEGLTAVNFGREGRGGCFTKLTERGSTARALLQSRALLRANPKEFRYRNILAH